MSTLANDLLDRTLPHFEVKRQNRPPQWNGPPSSLTWSTGQGPGQPASPELFDALDTGRRPPSLAASVQQGRRAD